MAEVKLRNLPYTVSNDCVEAVPPETLPVSMVLEKVVSEANEFMLPGLKALFVVLLPNVVLLNVTPAPGSKLILVLVVPELVMLPRLLNAVVPLKFKPELLRVKEEGILLAD